MFLNQLCPPIEYIANVWVGKVGVELGANIMQIPLCLHSSLFLWLPQYYAINS
jgi:hypothetical protein